MNKRIIAICFSFLMVGSIFGLIAYIPTSSPSVSVNPNVASSSLSGTAAMSASVSYWHNVGISNSGTTDVYIPIYENSSFSDYSFGSTSSWTKSSNSQSASWTQTFSGAPNYVYVSSNGYTLKIESVEFELGSYYDGASYTYYQELGTVYANMTIAGYTETWSHTFNYNEEDTTSFAVISPSWSFYANTPYYLLSDASSATLLVTATVDGDAYVNPPTSLLTTTVDQGQNVIVSNPSTTVDSVPFAQGYRYGTVYPTFTPTSDLTSFSVVWNGPFSSTQVAYNGATQTASSGTFAGKIATGWQSIMFGVSGDPSAGNLQVAYYAVSASFYLANQVQIQSATQTQSPTSAQSITENQNWWNSSISFSLSNPSGAIDNTALATTSGPINAGTYATWTVSDITVAGYNQNPAIDIWSYSGYQSGSINLGSSPPQYESISESSSQFVSSSGLSVSYNIAELMNYNPSVNIPSLTFVSGSTAQAVFTTSEQIAGEHENVVVNWGDGTTSTLSGQSPGTFTLDHTYSGSYSGSFSQTYNPYVTVTNLPNAASSNDLSTTSNRGSYTFSLTTNPTPPNSVLHTGNKVWMNYTQSNINFNQVSVKINGITGTAIETSPNHWYTSSSLFGKSGVTVTWTLDPNGVVDTQSIAYASPLYPTDNSTYLTFTGSNTATDTYSISISGSPSGTGTYQQEFTISNPSQYGINSAGSNFYITYTNGTPAYSWIQSINSTSLMVWSKLYNGTSQVELQVFPSFVNLLSATGYIGEAPQLSTVYAQSDNGKYVFPFYENFIDKLHGFTANYSQYVTANNGLKILDGNYQLTVLSNISMTNGIVLWNGQFNTGTSSNSISQGATVGTLYLALWFSGSGTDGFNWYNGSANPGLILFTRNGSSGSDSNFHTNTYQNYMVQVNQTNGNTYMDAYLNNILQQSQYRNGFTSSGSFGFFTQQTSVAYEVWNYMAYSPMLMTLMPSISIGSPIPTIANSSQIGYQHYASFSNDPTNLSLGQYSYTIPDSFNYNYITVWYPSSWTFDYSSWSEYSSGTTSQGNFLTFLNISGIGSITLTFNEPIVIGQPLGTLSIGAEPTVALGGYSFFDIPSGLVHWFANGNPVSTSGFAVVVGKPVNITAYGLGNIPLQISQNGNIFHNYTLYTPTSYISYLPIYVNISSIQFNNLNSTNEVEVIAENSLGVQQDQILLAPYGAGASSATMYLPSEKYTFYYTQLNYTTGQIIKSKVATNSMSYHGMYWITLNGLTIYQLGNQLYYANSSIQKSIQTLSISVSLNDSAIKNLTLGVDLNLSATNSSIQNAITDVLTNETFINDDITGLNVSIGSKLNLINSVIHTFQSNITVLDDYINVSANLIKNITTSINTNLSLANTTIGLIKTIDSQNFTALNSTIKSNYVSMINNISLVNSLIKNVNVSLSSRISFTNSLVNSSTTSITSKESYINSLINSTTTNITAEDLVINSTVRDLNFNETSYFTLLNSTIHNVNLTQTNYYNIIHDAVTSLNLSQTNYYNLISDSIRNVNLNLTTKFNILNSTINSLNLNFTTKFDIFNSTINAMNVNQSTYFNILHSIVGNINFNETQRYQLEKVAGTFAYHFVPKNENLLPNGVDVTSWLENVAGKPVDNKTLVYSIWQNLTIQYINLTNSYSVAPKLISYNNFSVTFFLPLNKTQIDAIQNGGGRTELSFYSPFGIGAQSNIATGTVNPSNANLEHVKSLYLSFGFASNPPSSLGPLIIWFFSAQFGRAVAELTVMLGGILTTLFVLKDRRGKNKDRILVQTYKNTKELKNKGSKS